MKRLKVEIVGYSEGKRHIKFGVWDAEVWSDDAGVHILIPDISISDFWDSGD